jgi:S1-C subfamily serine protease
MPDVPITVPKDPVLHVLKSGVPMQETDDLQPQADETSRRLFAEVAPSVVKIQADNGSGSGFYIDKDGDVATDAHVVLGSSKLKVITPDGQTLDARITKLDDINDLAILHIEDPSKTKIQPMQFGDSSALKADQPLWGFGHPAGYAPTYVSPGYFRHSEQASDILATEGENFVSEGKRRLEKLTPEERADADLDMHRSMFNGQVNIQKGDSGGPIADQKGEAVGLNDLSNMRSDSDFTPIEKLRALMDETTPKFNFTYKQTKDGLILTDISRTDGEYRAPFSDHVIIQNSYSPDAVPSYKQQTFN